MRWEEQAALEKAAEKNKTSKNMGAGTFAGLPLDRCLAVCVPASISLKHTRSLALGRVG